MNTFKNSKKAKKKAMALILTLGVIFMLGVIAGSFAFFTTTSSVNTNKYIQSISAYNTANTGYNFIMGSIHEYFDIVIPAVVMAKNKDNIKVNVNDDVFNSSYSNEEILSAIELFSDDYEQNPDNYKKLENDEFNQLRSALTNFLNGQNIDFRLVNVIVQQDKYLNQIDKKYSGSDDYAKSFENEAKNVDKGLGHSLNKLIFVDSGSWASKYGFVSLTDTYEKIKKGEAESYDIDLDGINNYIPDQTVDDQFPGLKGEELSLAYARLLTDPEFELGRTDQIEKFVENYEKYELKDANWHYVYDSNNNAISRFAVMAKDQSSLINLQGNLSGTAIDSISSSQDGNDDQTLSSDEIAQQVEQYQDHGINKINELIGNKDTTSSFTTTSINASEHLNLNTSDEKEIFSYLNQAKSDPTDDNRRSNCRIATNITDYTDRDHIPSVLAQCTLPNKGKINKDAWGTLPSDEIHMGIEGIRISEVMIHPEQLYKLGDVNDTDHKPLTIKLECTSNDDDKISEDRYYFKTKKDVKADNKKIYELDHKENIIKDTQIDMDDKDEAIILKKPITIRNPGAPYQFWMKMKISAFSDTKDKKNDLKDIDTTKAPDVNMTWAQDDDGTVDINNSIVNYISYKIFNALPTETDKNKRNKSYLYTDEMTKNFNDLVPDQTVYVKDTAISAGAIYMSVINATLSYTGSLSLKDDDIWISSNQELQNILIKSDDDDEKMNFMKYDNQRQNAYIDWGSVNNSKIGDLTKNIKDIQNKDSKDLEKNPYPFGTKVIEVAVFDQEANKGKDELIGYFYCVNTNDFKEDDTTPLPETPGDTKVPVSDDDQNYVWFYSVGVPDWVKPTGASWEDKMPSWMKALRHPDADDEDGALISDRENNSYLQNLCVFPREDCKLKFRFRLVDLGDSRFNGGDDVLYNLGVEKIELKDSDDKVTLTVEKDKMDEAEKLKKQMSMISRPRWTDGDKVTIEIKDMLITQQCYDTSLLQRAVTHKKAEQAGYVDDDSVLKDVLIPKTYRYINPLTNIIETALPKDTDTDISQVSQEKLIHYRNRRLENKAANELHAGEYIEIFNGTSSPVNLDGWMLKIEQYKNGELLSPVISENYYDLLSTNFETTEPLKLTISGLTGHKEVDTTAKATYALLKNSTLPANGLSPNYLPYGLVANGTVSLDVKPELDASFVQEQNQVCVNYGKTFQPLFFQNSTHLALGDSKMVQNIFKSTFDGKVFYDDQNYLRENNDKDNRLYYISGQKSTHDEDDNDCSIPYEGLKIDVGSGSYTLRAYCYPDIYYYTYDKDNIAIDSHDDKIKWYEVESGQSSFGNNHNYETFNILPGYLSASDTSVDFASYEGGYKKHLYNIDIDDDDYDVDEPDGLNSQTQNWVIENYKNNKELYSCDKFSVLDQDGFNFVKKSYHQKESYELIDPNFNNNEFLDLFCKYKKQTNSYKIEDYWDDDEEEWVYKTIHYQKIYIQSFKVNPFEELKTNPDFEDQFHLFELLQKKIQELIHNKYPNQAKDNLSKANLKDFYIKHILYPAFEEMTQDDDQDDQNLNLPELKHEKSKRWKYDFLPFITEEEKTEFFQKIFGKSWGEMMRLKFGGDTSYINGYKESTFKYDGTPSPHKTPAYSENLHFYMITKDIGDWAQLTDFFHAKKDNDLKGLIHSFLTDKTDDTTKINVYNFNPNPYQASADNMIIPFDPKLRWAVVPVLFNSARQRSQDTALKSMRSLNVNAGTAWDIDLTDTNVIQTVNIPQSPLTYDHILNINENSQDVIGITLNYNDYKSNLPQGKYPLNLRDDADQIIITLLAPRQEKNVLSVVDAYSNEFVSSLYQDSLHKIHGSNEKTVTDFDLAEQREWICSPAESRPAGEISLEYGIADRAILDFNKSAHYTSEDEQLYSWWGNRAMSLQTFFTDPKLVRLNSETIFNLPDTSENPARYFRPHDSIYKSYPGPLPENWALKAYGSPGYPNFCVSESLNDDKQSSGDPDVIHKAPPPVELDIHPDNMNRKEWLETDDEEALSIKDFYSYKYTGFALLNHQFLSYTSNNFFIKNEALASNGELCDIPAPSIESSYNASVDTHEDNLSNMNPLNPTSMINAFVDGLEPEHVGDTGDGNYIDEAQKEKIFSGTSTDRFELSPYHSTNLKIKTTKPYEQYLGANPVVKDKKGSEIQLIYRFYCDNEEALDNNSKLSFSRGKFKVMIEGLNFKSGTDASLFDAIGMIILSPDQPFDSQVKEGEWGNIGNTIDNVERIQDITVYDEDGAKEALNQDHVLQISPNNESDFYNISKFIEIRFVLDSNSNFLKGASATHQKVNRVVNSQGFSAIKIYLVPDISVGKVNINTAPYQTLLRLPGLNRAIDSSVSDYSRKAAVEVLEDIWKYLNEEGNFESAGNLLVARIKEGNANFADDNGYRRIFPVNGNDPKILNAPTTASATAQERESFAREKLRVFRDLIQHIQFNTGSFEIVSLGQSIKKVGDKIHILASQKISATVNLTNSLKDLSEKWVYSNDAEAFEDQDDDTKKDPLS